MLVLLFVLQRENRRSIDNTKHYLLPLALRMR